MSEWTRLSDLVMLTIVWVCMLAAWTVTNTPSTPEYVEQSIKDFAKPPTGRELDSVGTNQRVVNNHLFTNLQHPKLNFGQTEHLPGVATINSKMHDTLGKRRRHVCTCMRFKGRGIPKRETFIKMCSVKQVKDMEPSWEWISSETAMWVTNKEKE